MIRFRSLLMAFLISAGTMFAQWTPYPTGLPPDQSVLALTPVDDRVVWGITTASARFLRTLDGGLTWTTGEVSASTDRLVASLSALDSMTAWVAMYNPGGSVWRTTNGGTVWMRQETAFPSSVGLPIIIHFFDEAAGVCIGDPGSGSFEIYRTTTAGSVWHAVPDSIIPPSLPGESGTAGEFSSRGDTLWFGTSFDRVFRTTDRGRSWTVARVGFGEPGEEHVVSCAFANSLYGLAGNGTSIAFTADGGATWSPLAPSPGPSSWFLRHIAGTPASFMVTAFTPGIPGSAATLNGGAAWTTIDAGEYLPSSFASPSAGWCGSAGGSAVFRWSGPPLLPAGEGALIIGPPRLTFPPWRVGTMSDPLSIVLVNTGDDSISLLSVERPGADFVLDSPPETPLLLGPMQMVRLQIRSSPTREGETGDSIRILSDAPNLPRVHIPLRGSGVRIDPAAPGVLYAARDSLYQLNPSTGIATAIAPLAYSFTSLAIRPSDHALFGLVTGTPAGRLAMISTTTGTLWAEQIVPAGNLQAITFIGGDTLLAGSRQGALYRLDPLSGEPTLVGTAPGKPYSGFAFNPSTGRLYASARAPLGGRDSIYIVDPATGDAGPLGRTMLGVNTSSIAVDHNARLLAIARVASVTQLYHLDTTNAHATLVGSTGIGVLNALAVRTDSGLVAVEGWGGEQSPLRFALSSPYPNPFNPSTTVPFSLAERERAKVEVFDLLGRCVAVLVDRELGAGHHGVSFDAAELPSGVYFIRLTAGARSALRSVVLLR